MPSPHHALTLPAIALLLAAGPAVHAQQPNAGGPPMNAQPYDPAVKRRVVFTDWRFVDPGWFAWTDAEGNARGLGESVPPGTLSFKPLNSPFGVHLALQRPPHVGPLFDRDKPWEKQGMWIVTLLYEAGIYKAWVSCWEAVGKTYLCYFESKDGYHFDRPTLGLYEYEGSKDNNIIMDLYGNKAIFVDPVAPPEERYKMVIGDQPGGVRGAVSPDGLRWTMIPDPILPGDSDTQHVAYFDQSLGKYVLYCRRNDFSRRNIGRSESADFRHFPPSEIILEGTLPDMLPSVDLYTNCKTTIPMAPDLHLLFPIVYHREKDLGSIQMAVSRDGKFWSFMPGPPVVTATTPGLWDGGWAVASPNLVELPGGDFALPYYAQNVPHKYPRGLMEFNSGYALWPRGRIVALEAPEQGEFTTFPLDTDGGSALRLNALTEQAGSVLVEVDGVPGRSFADCDPIIGDQFRKVVTWKGATDLGVEAGKPVVLRFRMRQAKLFGLEFLAQ